VATGSDEGSTFRRLGALEPRWACERRGPHTIMAASRRIAPMLSIQCHEGLHRDCLGTCKPFFPDDCECDCHKRPKET